MDFLNSAFFTAFFGAIAGALSAAWLAWWTGKRRQLRDEILACNVAMALCASIANSFFTMKRQQIKPICERYEIEKGRLFIIWMVTAANGHGVFVLHYDLANTSTIWTPVDSLNGIVANRISSASRPAIAAASLTQAIHNHRASTELRNGLIQKLRGLPELSKRPLYFGYPGPDGHDTSYSDAVESLGQYTDDCLYFSLLLVDVLRERGEILANRLGASAPAINEADFSAAAELLPDVSAYKGFESQLRPKRTEMVVEM